MKKHPRLHDELEQAAQPDEDRAAQERNAGIAIAVLALVVVGLLLAIVLGAADSFHP
jgi:hypothetical protein